ncbi:hypothetical protein [Calothrix sp. PCC 6303]|nr:hypothetical protein [Calothrix sp. PCC 6303]
MRCAIAFGIWGWRYTEGIKLPCGNAKSERLSRLVSGIALRSHKF